MSDYPWWEEVPADQPLMQGDLIEECPVAVFNADLKWDDSQDGAALVEMLRQGVGIQHVRSIVMTQACDLEQDKVRNVILCPAYPLDDFRSMYEAEWQAKAGAPPKSSQWEGHIKSIKAGRMWNLTVLRRRDAGDGVTLTTPSTIVDFHEVFSVPVVFLRVWLVKSGRPRLRLLPPYREHLSQGFARFFMRVGLPVDITDL